MARRESPVAVANAAVHHRAVAANRAGRLVALTKPLATDYPPRRLLRRSSQESALATTSACNRNLIDQKLSDQLTDRLSAAVHKRNRPPLGRNVLVCRVNA